MNSEKQRRTKGKKIGAKGKGKREFPEEYEREMGEVEGVDGAGSELFVVAGPVVEGGKGEVVEDEVAVERVGVEPQLVPEADPGHVRSRRRRHPRGVPLDHRRPLPRGWKRRRRHRTVPYSGGLE